MPSKSAKQRKFMAAVSNNPAFAKKVGVPQSVGKEYESADKGKKFKRGGKMSNCGTKRMKSGGYHKMPDGSMMKDSEHKGYKKGGKTFPDLNKDGKTTYADVLAGRGVKKMAKGGKVRGAGMARQGVRPCKMR